MGTNGLFACIIGSRCVRCVIASIFKEDWRIICHVRAIYIYLDHLHISIILCVQVTASEAQLYSVETRDV